MKLLSKILSDLIESIKQYIELDEEVLYRKKILQLLFIAYCIAAVKIDNYMKKAQQALDDACKKNNNCFLFLRAMIRESNMSDSRCRLIVKNIHMT